MMGIDSGRGRCHPAAHLSRRPGAGRRGGQNDQVTAITSPLGTLTGRVTSRIDRLSDRRFALLSFLPAGILIAVIVLPPILAIFGMSLFRINLLRDNNTPFVGLTNYLRIADDANFLDSVPRTVIFAAGTTLLTVPLALGSAMVLNRRFRGAALLGVAILMPYAVAAVVTGLFWKFIFQSHFGIGPGSTALGIVHGPVLWLADSSTAMFVAVMATAWKYTPLYALLILASLKAIPEALYRAAKMDGATAWQSFRYVTLAGIRNTMLVVTILTIILSLQVFDVLFTLTGGGPGQSTTVIYYYVFKNTVDLLNFGYSAALAVFLLVVIVLCSMALLVVRLRDKGPTVADDDLTATARPEYTRDAAAKLAALHVGADDQAPRRRFVLPAWVGRWTFRIAVALLLFWLLAPIGGSSSPACSQRAPSPSHLRS